MIKDKWIYQESKSAKAAPWALYCIKEYEPKCKFVECVLDITFYSEDIDNSEHSLSFLNWNHRAISGYVNQIRETVQSFGGEFTFVDAKHVESELVNLFFD